MDNLFKKYVKGDAILWVVFIGLCMISIIEMYSASSVLAYSAASHTDPILRHTFFLIIGVITALLVQLVPYRYIRLFAYLGVAISGILLIWVLIGGHSENNASRWLVIAGIKFQPSEIAKISVIILVADLISRIKDRAKEEKKHYQTILIVVSIICALILPENFSTAILLFGVVFLMMFIGNVSLVRLGVLLVSLFVLLVIVFGIVKVVPKEYMPSSFDRAYTWVGRIERFSQENKSEESKYIITDENRQVVNGRIAIARGGLLGVFPGNSVQRDFLAQAYSDFIFEIIIGELGLIGGIFVILLYLILLFRAGRIATMSPTVFPAILVVGLSLMIVSQAFVSMAVASSLGPVTGQPLPLISRGGTSIIITCIYFGIILGITRQIKEDIAIPGVDNVLTKEKLDEMELDKL
jgi:cell division protein FtsW